MKNIKKQIGNHTKKQNKTNERLETYSRDFTMILCCFSTIFAFSISIASASASPVNILQMDKAEAMDWASSCSTHFAQILGNEGALIWGGDGLSEDDQKFWEDEVQSLTDTMIKAVDTSLEKKQTEIMQV